METIIYTVDGMEFELRHYGVKGMKWGRRKARPAPIGGSRRGGQPVDNSPEAQAAAKEARRQKVKRAAKIGAAVVGTALAAYGGYKLAKYVQDKRNTAAMQKAQAYIDKHMFQNIGHSKFQNGTMEMYFRNGRGDEITAGRTTRDSVGKAVGKLNAKVVAEGRQMYRDATNTRLDRGLARVVGAGDAVGNAAKRAGTKAGNAAKRAGASVGNTARKAKNAVLDVVNPIYENVPGKTTTRTLDYGNGITMNKTYTGYYKRKRKRV